MAKQIKIKTVSYVHVGDQLVCTDDLTPEQKLKVAVNLKITYLNELFRGKAVFSVPPEYEYLLQHDQDKKSRF